MFEKLSGEVQGPVEVTGELEVEGTIRGGADVSGFLDLIGTCDGPLVVLDGGNADVEAVVHGDVRVSAGRLRLRGIVDGSLQANPDSDVALAVGTVVGGLQLREDGTLVRLQAPAQVAIDDDAPMLHLSPDGRWVVPTSLPARPAGRHRVDETPDHPATRS